MHRPWPGATRKRPAGPKSARPPSSTANAIFAELERWDTPGHWQQEARAQKRYFTTNRERIRYKDYRARGYPIASGVVEAACKTLICQRHKQPGMRWRRETAEAIAHLRAVHESGRWDHLRRKLILASTNAA